MSIRDNNYDKLLKNDMRRRERNVRLLTKLENIEKKAAFLQAKTDRIRSLKSIYRNHFSKIPSTQLNNYVISEKEYVYPERYTNQYNQSLNKNYNVSENTIENQNQRYIMKNITLDEAIEEIARRYILIPKTPLAKTIVEEKYSIDPVTNITEKNLSPYKKSLDPPNVPIVESIIEKELSIPDILTDESNDAVTSNDITANNDSSSNNESKDDATEKHLNIDDPIENNEMESNESLIEDELPNQSNQDEIINNETTEDPRLKMLSTEIAYNEEIGEKSPEINANVETEPSNDYVESAPQSTDDLNVTEQTYYDENQTYNVEDNQEIVDENALNTEYDQNYNDYVPQEDSQNNFIADENAVASVNEEQYFAEQIDNAEIQNNENIYNEEQVYPQSDNTYDNNHTNQLDGENTNDVYDYQNNPETNYEQDYNTNQPTDFVEQSYNTNEETYNENQDVNYDQYQGNGEEQAENPEIYNPDATDDTANIYNAENSQEYQQDQTDQEQYNAENSQYNYYEQEGDSQYYNESTLNNENIDVSEDQQAKPLQILDSDTDQISNRDETSVQESDFDFSTQQ